jgi:putative flavoprotein involved in K+ transport
VVLIGAANSAVQIATELSAVAQVTLATREPVRFFPQRILGQDFHFWMKWTGLDRSTWLSDQSTPVLDDGKYRRALNTGQIRRKAMFHRITAGEVVWKDGSEEEVDVLLFATGFRPTVSYLGQVEPAGTDYRAQRNGIARHVPGLYYVGFPKQRNFASATLRGVGADAAHIVPHLVNHLSQYERKTGTIYSAGTKA